MKFLLYSECGEGAQVLKAIEEEGNTVGLYIHDKIYKSAWDGLLPKVEPESFIDEETVIIFDMSGNGKLADDYKKQGHFVYGASEFADKLEHDRQFGFDVMKEVGIKVPDTKEFKTFKEGIDYVRQSNKRLVFKPSGSMPCKLTYVSKDQKDLLRYLQFVESRFSKHIDSFILQEFIEGIVVSTEYFCTAKGFINPVNHTVEVKKSMNDDLGPSTGCSGNIAWPCEGSSIAERGCLLVEDICVREQYTGQIDLNAVINESGVYGLEWTPRFGYDATPTFLSLITEDLGKFFSDIARNQFDRDLPVRDRYSAGVRVSIPPYPAEPMQGQDTEKVSPNQGVPIQGFEKYENLLYFYEVRETKDGLEHSGGTGVIACAIDVGASPEAAITAPYKVLEEISIPDKQYRTDLKAVLSKMVDEVEEYA